MSKRNKLILIVSSFAVVSVLVVAVSAYLTRDKIAQSLIEENTQNNLALAGQAAGLLEKEIQTIQDKVSLVAELSEIRSSNFEACSRKLAEVAPHLQGQADNITRFNTDLILDCAVNKAAIGYMLTPSSEITALIKNLNHIPNLSRSGYSPVTDKYVLYLTVPVFAEDGSYYGIIGGVTYLDYFAEKYLENIKLAEGGYLTLLDDDGTILYYPDETYIGQKFDSPEAQTKPFDASAIQNLSERSGSLRHSSMGEDLISVSARADVFPGRTWTVILTVPVASAIAGINTSQGLGGLNVFLSLSGLIILVLIVFSALITAYIISGLFRPLSDISAAAEKVGEGNLKVEMNADLLSAKDEFGQLARVIKGMAVKLNESYLLLEERVEERTKDLMKRTEELKKMNSFMMGREIKMAELKEENTKLKKQLGADGG